MIVVDASVLANALIDPAGAGTTARRVIRAAEEITAPDLIDVETASVLRRALAAGRLDGRGLATAIRHLEELAFERVPTRRLVRRALELRANVSAYDGCYVALAEARGCDLVTGDARLAAAPVPRCVIRLLRPGD